MGRESKIPIKNWDVDDRPRERFIAHGPDGLSNAELFAILIQSGSLDKSAVELMREVLRSCGGNLKSLSEYSVRQLCEFKGIGEAKAVTIKAALELSKRRLEEYKFSKPSRINNSEDVFRIMRPVMMDLDHEEFWCLMLNNANIVTDRIMISSGGMTETTVDIRMIMRQVILCKACGVVILHNHPSGNLQPSVQDQRITGRIKEALNLFGIRLLDHVIVADNAYYSFADEGHL